MAKSNALIMRRKAWNQVFLMLSVAAAAFGILWLTLILYELLSKGIGGLNLKVFTEITPAGNDEGGLANAIVGTLEITSLAVVLGTPVGLLAGTYLAEYGRGTRIGEMVRAAFSVLMPHPEGLPAKDVIARTEERLTLSEFEKSDYPNHPGLRRFDKLVRFATIPSRSCSQTSRNSPSPPPSMWSQSRRRSPRLGTTA